MTERSDLLRVDDLAVSFPVMGGEIRAVRGISMRLRPGKVTALVGESGSGKSVLGRSIIGIESDAARVAGTAVFTDPETGEQIDLLRLPKDSRKIRAIRGNRIGMIFQEPMTSFSPTRSRKA